MSGLTRRRRRPLARAAIAVLLLMTIASPVVADEVEATGDGVVPNGFGGKVLALGTICQGVEASRDIGVAVVRVPFAGLTTWLPGGTVTVTVQSTSGDGLSATVPAAPDNQVTTPSNWGQLGDGNVAGTVPSTLSLTAASTGSFQGSILYRGSGPNANSGTHTDDGALNVTADVIECTPGVAPTITVTSPAADAVYEIGSSVAADYGCSSDSPLTQCSGPVADGAMIDTSTVGPKSFQVDAAEADGDSATETVNYRVVYPFEYIAPTLESPGTNHLMAGAKRTIRFSMDGNSGTNVIQGWPRHRPVNCDTGEALGRLTVGRIYNFRYEAGSDQYVLLWKTAPGWDDTCRDFVVRLRDGTQHVARFAFDL